MGHNRLFIIESKDVHPTTISTLGRDNNGVIRVNIIFIDGQHRD
jgi:hypothetical protein